jgi:hypothetical protein
MRLIKFLTHRYPRMELYYSGYYGSRPLPICDALRRKNGSVHIGLVIIDNTRNCATTFAKELS